MSTKRHVLVIAISLLSAPAFGADTIQVIRTSAGRLVLKGPNCDQVNKQVKALRAWTQKLKEPLSAEDKKPSAHWFWRECTVDITDIVPKRVAQFHGVKPNFDGPNCWNSALVLSRLAKEFRLSWADEISFWMDSPLCRELRLNEKLEPGDIVMMRHVSGEHHACIYISPELVFSKNGSTKTTPFALQSLEGVLKYYKIPKESECRRTVGRSSSDSCWAWVNYFRCKSLEEYEKSYAPESYQDIDHSLSSVERQIHERAMKGNPLFTPDFQDLIGDVLLANIYFAKQKVKECIQRKPASGDPETTLWLGALRRAESLRLHLLLMYY